MSDRTVPGLGAAFYFLYLRDGPWREIRHEESWKLNGRAPAGAAADPVTEPSAVDASASARREKATGGTVTIWLDVDPFDAHVTLNGSPITDRPITVPAADSPIQLRATAPGKEPLSVDVVPDRDRTVQLRLRKEDGKSN